MSTQTATTYDVFLSYPLRETGIAEQVARSMEQAGLDIFWDREIELGENLQDTIWRALAESAALIAIIPPEGPLTSNIAVEVGAFKAWCKPIYIIQEARRSSLPAYLADCQIYPLSRIDDIAASIKRGLAALTEDVCKILANIYGDYGVPVDQILSNPIAIEKFAEEFNTRCRKKVTGERLVQELLRLRKRGRLPRIRH